MTRTKRNGVAILIILALGVQLFPLLWVLIASFRPAIEFTTASVLSLPKKYVLDNYVRAWFVGRFGTYFVNSAFATIGGMTILLLLSTTAAYALSILQWRFSKKILFIFVSGILIPPQVILIPLTLMYRDMGVYNTIWSLVLTYAGAGMAMAVYLFSGFFLQVPREVIEAAAMDGCTPISFFRSILLPISQTAVMTVMVVQFVWMWNDLLFSMTFISNSSLRTLQTGLMNFEGTHGQKEWGPIFAGIIISVVPTLSLYLGLNSQVMKGMTAGAVKG